MTVRLGGNERGTRESSERLFDSQHGDERFLPRPGNNSHMAKRRRTTLEKLRYLFEQQSVELGDYQVVICPLCLRVFGSEDIETGLLTIEHAPQRSHRGPPPAERCLTCNTCNHECGFEARAGWRSSKRDAAPHLLPGHPQLVRWENSPSGLATPVRECVLTQWAGRRN